MVDKEKAAKLLTLGIFEYAVARLDLLYQRREDGKGLSQNDFTNELKAKLDALNPDDGFATADEVDEVLDQYFPGDVDPDEPTPTTEPEEPIPEEPTPDTEEPTTEEPTPNPDEPGSDISGEEAGSDDI